MAARALEEAADAIARLEVSIEHLPPAFALALRHRAIAEFAGAGDKGTRALVAASANGPLDQSGPDERLSAWLRFIDDEERRARTGAPLTMSRLERAGFTLPPDREGRERLERALRSAPVASGATDRPAALERALDVAAALPVAEEGDAVACLVLCGEGRIDRVRTRLLADLRPDARDHALAAWRGGDPAAWNRLALGAVAGTARATRRACAAARLAIAEEDDRVGALGRAAINVRRALAVARAELATTVPALGDALRLSRPAAGDAVERLATLGLVEELTGRQRGRVFAYHGAMAVRSDA